MSTQIFTAQNFVLMQISRKMMMYDILRREVGLCYGFVRRDLGTGLLPVPAFTTASLLYRGASYEDIIPGVARTFAPSHYHSICINDNA